jgi:multisubunit Na+/H+ antiporter MnhE subunit
MKAVKKLYAVLDFLVYYLVKLVTANIFIAMDILTPRMRTSPAFIRMPVTIRSGAGLLLFSNLLSMTPGTLTIEISEDKQTILVHVLYSQDEKKVIQEIRLIQEKVKRITE